MIEPLHDSSVVMLLITIAIWGVLNSASQIDIDYSHNVVGTGTLMTDYKMGSDKNTEASGKVRGTGEVVNKYIFQSRNGSENVTIEDQFLLSQIKTPHVISLKDYPQMTKRPGSFKLIGTKWSGELLLPDKNESKNQSA